MYYTHIANLVAQKNQRLHTNLLLFLVIPLIAYLAQTFSVPIIRFPVVAVIVFFSSCFVMSVKKEGFAAGFCVFLGCATIIGGLLITNDITVLGKSPIKFQLFHETASDQIQRLHMSKDFLHLYSLFTGVSCMALGMIFAYKPSFIQVKNFVPYEYPYPIWNSKTQPMTKFSNLMSTRDLLTHKERMLLCRYKYLLVSINGKLYLVPPNELIPEDSIVMRTKSGNTLCGISRF
ncbi:MAG TPA: hypothetical protein VNK44_03580 [Candidatus Nitrosotenuis sp.]|nr:hypothetical protein [Candidatus Nitrosotenuis sp.]